MLLSLSCLCTNDVTKSVHYKNILTSGHGLVQDWDSQTAPQIITELCGFVTILAGTFLLHATKDMSDTTAGLSSFTTPPGKHIHPTVTHTSGLCT